MKLTKPRQHRIEEAWKVIALEYAADRGFDFVAALDSLNEGDDASGLACQMFGFLLDLALGAGKLKPNDFFRITKEASWDRPSAFSVWCEHHKWRDAPDEISMHGLEEDELKYLRKKFKGKIPPALEANDWDT